ncbi:MAG: bifunctional 5,10-methylenetetrahydrofolate dehydrogenase/5,10-methenyltetrahydrofolate cyclohydrolase [Chloroflexota bacterium]
MAAMILDGRMLAKTLREELRTEIQQFTSEVGITPTLAVVHVEGDSASERYVRSIQKACDNLGIHFIKPHLAEGTQQDRLESVVRGLSEDEKTHGILLQLPLPAGLDADTAIAQLDPRKDVDGIHPSNAGLLMQGEPRFVPNTPAGGIELLQRYNIEISGKRAVIVGRSMVVGKPMSLLLLQSHATVTIAHSRTPDLAAVVREADIVVVAAGRAKLVDGSMIRPGAVVVDFGINVQDDGSMTGDVDFASASEVASAITPVPGGTGPVTNVMLLRNVLHAARLLQT